ncbi:MULTISPECIES: hypothetical protein [unclassified Legionella]|uniref:hypothetical protein n=1 Tax=unclassified Legionella TaxID=2622702 RepID=UPI0010556EBF|nr:MULTISPECIES: hypothetical protein [unclassified Legionella]MDI9819343.1 hypothetical protein [Legionella sp. PL877]
MTAFRVFFFVLLSFFINTLFVAPVFSQFEKKIGVDPIAPRITSNTTIPAASSLGGVYLVAYTVTSNLPFTMPTAFSNSLQISAPSGEFTVTDHCNGIRLSPGQSCEISVGLNARTTGNKSAVVYLNYGKNSVPIRISTRVTAVIQDAGWSGLIGVDYQPNHYPNGNPFNGHDVFYSGTANGLAITNVYAELSQLKAAGFNTVRSYQTVEYAWIDIINQANALGMKVVYEAVIPQNGSQTDITNAITVLNHVIDTVGTTTFNNTVILLFAGHENYSNTNINYLTSAITQLKSALASKGITNVPVGSALISGNLVTPSPAIAADMTTLVNSYSANAPWAFDPYPFQWGVSPPDQAVSNVTLINSIAWDYAQVISQSFYTAAPRTIIMAETGWATSGLGTYAGYFCATQNNCAPSVANAGTYLTALYAYVGNSGNNSGALVFEAYNEPAKDPVHADNAENFYGVFDSNCGLKGVSLLPNRSFSIASNPGCAGFTSGALFNVIGGNTTTQPQFEVQVSQTNPVTMADAGITAIIPNENRDNMAINPWPYFVVYNGAEVTINGTGTGNSCSVTVSVAGGAITGFSAVNCTGAIVVNCNAGISACFLPADY